MSVSNLAIVFAPSILRSITQAEEKSEVMSAEEMMKSKDEVSFVANIFSRLTVNETYLHADWDPSTYAPRRIKH